MSSPLTPVHDIVIKSLTSRDVPNVRELHSKVLPVRYPPSFFLQLLVLPTRACFVAYRRGQLHNPIGFISAAAQQPTPNNNFSSDSSDHPPSVSSKLENQPVLDLGKSRLEILTLGVHPAYRHCGLARRLVQSVVDNFQQSCAGNYDLHDGTLIYANVSISNTTALKFYEHMGMLVSSETIRNLYRTVSQGSRDAYLVVGIL
ncbi:acyl-CoA N-acyltransferase [Crassisporium funariophilum]|nr:acyl-CoA N-acyltransferase [Crassisporium funariophilum]